PDYHKLHRPGNPATAEFTGAYSISATDHGGPVFQQRPRCWHTAALPHGCCCLGSCFRLHRCHALSNDAGFVCGGQGAALASAHRALPGT
ncbi:unnamed protein product, partial [Polarella glacialis]